MNIGILEYSMVDFMIISFQHVFIHKLIWSYLYHISILYF